MDIIFIKSIMVVLSSAFGAFLLIFYFRKIDMITLGIQDLERAISFYEEGLGLPRKQFEGNVAFFEVMGSWLALYPWDALAEDTTDEAYDFESNTLRLNIQNRSMIFIGGTLHPVSSIAINLTRI